MQKQLKDVNCYVLERDQGRKASEEMEARYQNQIAKLTQSLQQHDMERLKMEEERKRRIQGGNGRKGGAVDSNEA